MNQIPLKAYYKHKLFEFLSDLSDKEIRAEMHNIQGEDRKHKNILNPKEVETLLINLGYENLILKTSNNETNQQKSN